MQFSLRSHNCVKLIIGVILIIILVKLQFINIEPKPVVIIKYENPLLKEWRKAMFKYMIHLQGNAAELWENFPAFIKTCKIYIGAHFNVTSLVNKDDGKFHISPKKGLNKSTVLTVGVGNDVEAERQLQVLLRKQVDFFGVDPVVIPNQFIYADIGLFFPFAVGVESGLSNALVLQNGAYAGETVLHIDFIYYLTKIIRRKFIDALWLDAEYAEYDLFPIFARGGALDQYDITICQINMEIHLPDSEMKKKAHDFFFRIVDDQRYAIVNAVPIGHMRIYMVNLESEWCLRRYPYRYSKEQQTETNTGTL